MTNPTHTATVKETWLSDGSAVYYVELTDLIDGGDHGAT